MYLHNGNLEMEQQFVFWDHDWGEGILRFRLPNLNSFTVEKGMSLQTVASEQHMEHLFRPNLSTLAQQELGTLWNLLAWLILRQSIRDEMAWKIGN